MSSKIFAFREVTLFDSIVKKSVPLREEDDSEGYRDLFFKEKQSPSLQKEAVGFGYAFRAHLDDISDLEKQHATRNRFIICRIAGDVLELCDVSLDLTLRDNGIRIHFGSTLLPSVGFYEVPNSGFYVVVATSEIRTLHRLYFPHPTNKLERGSAIQPSIFADYNEQSLRDGFHLQNICRNTVPKHVAFINEHCVALGCLNGSIFLVKFLRTSETEWTHSEIELVDTPVLKRIWTGIVSKGDTNQQAVHGMAVHHFLNSTFLILLCADQKIRVWSISKQVCIDTKSIVIQEWRGTTPVKVLRQELRYFSDYRTPNSFQIVIFLQLENSAQFQTWVASVATDQVNLKLEKINYCDRWTVGSFEVNTWCQAYMEMKIRGISGISSIRNVYEYYVNIIFEPGRFSKWVLEKSIQVFREKYGMVKRVYTPFTTLGSLKSEIIADIQDQITEIINNSNQEPDEYFIYQSSCSVWKSFLELCLEGWRIENTCLGFCVDQSNNLIIVIKWNTISFIRPCEELEALEQVVSECWKNHIDSAMDALLTTNAMTNTNTNSKSELIESNVIHLVGCLNLISHQLGPEALYLFKEDLFQKLEPSEYMFPHISWLIGGVNANTIGTLTPEHMQLATTFMIFFNERFFKVKNPLLAIKLLLAHFEKQYQLPQPDLENSLLHRQFCSNLLKSSLSDALAGISFRQVVESRFHLLQSLNVLLFLLLARREFLPSNIGKVEEFISQIQTQFLPAATHLVKTYYATYWMIHQTVVASQIPETSLQESPLEQFSSLNLSEKNPERDSVHAKIEQGGNIIQLYYSEQISEIQSNFYIRLVDALYLATNKQPYSVWNFIQPFIWWVLNQLNIPEGILKFGNFLAKKGQITTLHEYIRLLNHDSVRPLDQSQNNQSFFQPTFFYYHLLALCYLNLNKFYKARDYFAKAASLGQIALQPHQDSFREIWIEEEDDNYHSDDFLIQYYKLTMELFETYRQYDYVIEFAQAAIPQVAISQAAISQVISQAISQAAISQAATSQAVTSQAISKVILQAAQLPKEEGIRLLESYLEKKTKENIRLLEFFYTSIFHNALTLSNFDLAYEAICHLNSESEKKQICLKRLVLALAEKDVPKLCSYPWIGFLSEVNDILQEKAQITDIIKFPNHYKVLYTFHCSKLNYLQAAQSVFEYAQRLPIETNSKIEALYEKVSALALVLSSLRLVDEKFQWLYLKERHLKTGTSMPSPKRKSPDESSIEIDSQQQPRETEYEIIPKVFTLRDIEKLYTLTKAQVTLFEVEGKIQPSSFDTVDVIISSLAEYDFFDKAIALAKMSSCNLESFFKILARKLCETDESQPEGNCYCVLLWKTIDKCLKMFDSVETNFHYHCVIADRILAYNSRFSLPTWFVNSFKRCNPGALLRLYIKYQNNEEAHRIAIDLLTKCLAEVTKSANPKHFLERLNIPWNIILDLNDFLNSTGKPNEIGQKLKEIENRIVSAHN